jgi:hypothetical protein
MGSWPADEGPHRSGKEGKVPEITVSAVLQLLVGVELLLVWVVRAKWATAFRGGDAKTLKEEFATYGLPLWFFHLIAVLKIGSAVALIVGLWVPELVLPGAGLAVALMLGALSMHYKIRDPLIKYRPAFTVFLMSAAVVVLQFV